MALLHIAFQDGFADDTIVIKINGGDVYRQDGIKTKYQISFAGSFETDIEEGTLEVEVLVPTRRLSDKTTIQVSNDVYIGVSVTDGKIDFRFSDEPFRYA